LCINLPAGWSGSGPFPPPFIDSKSRFASLYAWQAPAGWLLFGPQRGVPALPGGNWSAGPGCSLRTGMAESAASGRQAAPRPPAPLWAGGGMVLVAVNAMLHGHASPVEPTAWVLGLSPGLTPWLVGRQFLWGCCANSAQSWIPAGFAGTASASAGGGSLAWPHRRGLVRAPVVAG